jgi:serine/threonine protein kinase/CheY-like chemotaxis protein
LLDNAVMLGLINREQAQEARAEAEDRELETVARVLVRKGFLTSWQLERLRKGDAGGFFFGGCKVIFHLAEGTFARVYRGMRAETGEPVAVKVLRRRFSNDPESVARFNKEAEEGMRLQHPNIVKILDFGNADRQHYMLMEYVEGSNLRDLLKIRQRVDPVMALPMMLGLSRGLKYSFDQGITHRDIKASNILVSTGGQAKLVDFGLATIESEGKKAASLNPRTVDYSALERTCGSQKGDPRSDIFFLGCVFYQMITGQLAMAETETKDMLQKMLKRSFSAIKPLHEHRYAPDAELTRVIEKMMRVELSARYQTVEQVISDLEAYESHHKPGVVHAEAADADELDENAIFAHSMREREEPKAKAKTPATARTVPAMETESIIAPTPVPDHADAVALAEAVAEAVSAMAPESESESEPAPAIEAAAHNGTTATTTTTAAAEVAEAVGAVRGRYVLCVESQAMIQDAFRKALSKMGYHVILIGDPERAAERYCEQPTDAVIFDADGLGPEAVNALNAMHEKAQLEGHNLNALVLLAPRQLALRAQLPLDHRLVVLAKPIKMKQVQDAITMLLPIGT